MSRLTTVLINESANTIAAGVRTELVDVAAGSNAAIVAFAGQATAGYTVSAVSINAKAGSLLVEKPAAPGYQISIWAVPLAPGDAGAGRTLQWTNDVAITEGGAIGLAFYSDIDATPLIASDQDGGASGSVTLNGTVATEDPGYVFAAGGSYNDRPVPTWVNLTSLGDRDTGSMIFTFADDESGAGSLAMQLADGSYAGMAVASIRAAAVTTNIAPVGAVTGIVSSANTRASGVRQETVTIPATAQFAVITFGGAETGITFGPVTLNGKSATLIGQELDDYRTAAYYVYLEAGDAGSGRVLQWTNSVPITLGGNIQIRYYLGVALSDPIFDVATESIATGPGDTAMISVDYEDGCYVAVAANGLDSVAPVWYGSTLIGSVAGGSSYHEYAEGAKAGAGTTNVRFFASYPTMVGFSIKPQIVGKPEAQAGFDAQLVSRSSTFASTDATLLAVQSASATVDGVLSTIEQAAGDLDAVLKQIANAQSSADAYLQGSQSAGTGFDAQLAQVTQTLTFAFLDAVLSPRPQFETTQLDAVLAQLESAVASLDAVLGSAKIAQAGADGILQTQQSVQAGADGILATLQSTQADLDAILQSLVSATASFDAILATEGMESATGLLDAYLRGSLGAQGQFDASVAQRLESGSSLDANLVSVLAQSVAMDAQLLEGNDATALLDAQLFSSGGATGNLDGLIALLQQTSSGFDATLKSLIAAQSQIDAWLWARLPVSAAFDGIVGTDIIPVAKQSRTIIAQPKQRHVLAL